MEQQIIEQSALSTNLDEVQVCLGETTALTLGTTSGSSEDKRYVYN